jgi:teichoic acid transport system permease protein
MSERVTVYEAGSRSLPELRPLFHDLWNARALAWAMAAAQIKASRQNTWLGRAWAVLDPLLLGLTYFLLFAVILGDDTSLSYLAFLLGGIFAYNFTRRAVVSGATSVIKGGAYLTATQTPRALLPISAVLAALQVYVPTLGAYAIIYLLGGYRPGWSLAVLPVLVAIQTFMNLGIALLAATATAYFRDVTAFLPYVLRIGMYLTPVLYAVDDVPARLRWILAVNPLAPLFAAWQTVLFEGRWPSAAAMGMAAAWAAGLLVAGAWVFLRREREFALLV